MGYQMNWAGEAKLNKSNDIQEVLAQLVKHVCPVQAVELVRCTRGEGGNPRDSPMES